MKIIEGKWKDGVIIPLKKIEGKKSSKVFILLDLEEVESIQKKIDEINIRYFKLLSELVPEEDLPKKERKKLEKIVKENKERGYVSLEEFKRCLR